MSKIPFAEKIKRVNEQESKRAVGSSIDQGFFEESTAEKVPVNKLGEAAKLPTSKGKSVSGALPEGFFDSKGRKETKSSRQVTQTPKASDGAEIKHTKGALPDGFFDNKDADLRARGIEPVKVDIKYVIYHIFLNSRTENIYLSLYLFNHS